MHFIPHTALDTDQIVFTLGTDRSGKTTISMKYGPGGGNVAIVTAPAITMWPRCTGDGNFGTMWGPQDVTKAKFTLDLTDQDVNGTVNTNFADYAAKLNAVDDKLLEFVTENQLKILGRKNLSKEDTCVPTPPEGIHSM